MMPSTESCTPENNNNAAIKDPQPNAGPSPAIHKYPTAANVPKPAPAKTSPNNVARRNGNTEKLTTVLIHSRTSRRRL